MKPINLNTSLKVERDVISSIPENLIGQAVILMIMYNFIFKTKGHNGA